MAAPLAPRRLTVRVTPGSRKGPLVEPTDAWPGVELLVFVRERAVDGAANDAVVRALASYLEVRPADVRIVRGGSSRVKLIEVGG
ncbi:DUF167 domain-containing protein [Humibacter ginsenosidimutans]|uniref:DUF167 domain-containing protein n=1 Tax=Humibacter ginsenosidimutans TaxID=2599293 RepID=A0A5B8M817_9MICO|nr:DUF167 domain-containing protein [Humibacter ginsenosidimutans]QDZ16164.1 DUF167 domain-containing protein [Humibacter ginsenosidimutans]